MADAIFSSLLKNLNSLAVQEFGIAWGLETELKNLESTLDKDLKIPEKARHLLLNTKLTEKVPWNKVMPEVTSLRSLVLGEYSEFCGDEVARLVLKQKYLRALHLRDHLTIEKVLRSISNCKHLRFLNLSHSRIKSVPESVCDLQNLETLKLHGCYELWGGLSIKKLDNVRSSDDADRANLQKKQDLVSLTLQWSESKEEILPNDVEEVLESLQPHRNLKNLTIYNYQGLKFPNWMLGSVLKNLVKLSLNSCSRCERLPPLGKLHSLKNLQIWNMDSLKYFDPECYGDGEISFPALENLTLQHMPGLEEWTTVDRQYIFPYLRTLEIGQCPKLTKLPFLPTLESLTFRANELLLRAVSNLTRLTSLLITDFQLEILPDGLFQNMKALKSLSIRLCPTLENLSGLENLNSLESLRIFDCPSLTDRAVQGLEGLTSLRSLTIQYCRKLRSLPEGMEHLTVLQHLRISDCPEFQSFSEGMQHLDALQSLAVYDCEGLLSLPNWLGSLQSLSSLDIFGCPSLRSMPDGLRGQKNLRKLWIADCPHLKSRCKKDSGEDWLKIAHIPNIWINHEKVQSLDD
ncbi:hypothetical protein Vadar_011887 [Vaccinium darrowii]|uniref:Uncharacterized protein n=1 Tax=Vaccinium darrowii TaxID=229202 RepID=A0ACB7Y004_9ERIC|nr:hypothetical protein Vadar_011887 [Vaccinium darrowii]